MARRNHSQNGLFARRVHETSLTICPGFILAWSSASHYECPITVRTTNYKLITSLRLLSNYRVLQSTKKFAALREFRRNARGYDLPVLARRRFQGHWLAAIWAVVLFSPLVAPAWSQEPAGPVRSENSQSIKKGKALKAETEIALINVSVTDPYGRLVTGLEQHNFRVFEDGVEQEIVRFSSEDVPVSIGLIFDMSGSMGDKIAKSRLAAIQFFRTANPQDEFFLVNFNDRAQLMSPFTPSVDEIQDRLTYTGAHGLTALYDGVYLGLSQMKGARNTKRALLIISDGGDNHSRYTENDVRRFVEEAGVQIYAIGLFEPDGGPTPEERGGPQLLDDLTRMTGGRDFVVQNLAELPDIATKISMELR